MVCCLLRATGVEGVRQVVRAPVYVEPLDDLVGDGGSPDIT